MVHVTIGGKDLYTEYNLILASRSIEPPEAQTKYVSVPSRNGSIDLTESVSGVVRYNDRTINLSFMYVGENRPEKASEAYKFMHGQRLNIIFDDDPTFHYIGRINCTDWNEKQHGALLKMEIEAEPFKYDNTPSNVDWEWDTFDFEDGIINEMGELEVDGSLEVTLICRRALEYPTFTLSADMAITYDGVTYQVKAGTSKIYNLAFQEGNNVLTFTGTGTISIEYIGGEL